jgi:4-diphosphocytidyl-2-C-methyl-D-erythritol kinase
VNSLNIRSYAKLNLYLKVLNKRKDSYHNIQTLFERINLYDEITLTPRRDKRIKIICNHPGVPKGKENLAYRAANLLRNNPGIDKGIDIKIKKRIPVAFGLGGGSSNAASLLLGLNRLWNLRLNQKELIYYAKILGADVPFFIYSTAFAWGRRRGDQLKTIHTKNRFWHVLIIPNVKKISTKSVYEKLDKIRCCSLSGLTNRLDNVKILNLGIKKNNISYIRNALFNQLEWAASELNPRLKEIKQEISNLLNIPLAYISMSGSGPAMFILVFSRKEGKSLCKQLKSRKTWRGFLVKTF